MLKIILVRHFATEGNRDKRYIGTTDEPLCREGKQLPEGVFYPAADAVFISPLRRCAETAKLIYPTQSPITIEGFRECDFGGFENKNYRQLSGNPAYQAWIDSNGTMPFPNGEDPADFKRRSVAAFEEAVRLSMREQYETIALVVHGGTIMSILEHYAKPHEDYYHWQTDNGRGYCAELIDHTENKRDLETKQKEECTAKSEKDTAMKGEDKHWNLINICTLP